MLWSLVKIVLFVVFVAALALAVGAWIETGEGIVVSAGGYEISPGPLQTLILALLLFLSVWFVIRLAGFLVACLRFLSGDETAISRWFDRNRERKGYEALADGMLALASGEGKRAWARAARAEKYLNRPALTDLLSAQAAEMTGDSARAAEVYKRLLTDDRTRFVGVRGLLKQRLEAGDTDVALKLARKAFDLNPRHEETQDVLLSLQAEDDDWSGARATLGAKLRHGSIPKDLHRRRDAVLALATALEAKSNDETETVRTQALEANRLSPELVPAAVLAAGVLAEDGAQRKAVKILQKAWASAPHPDIARAFAGLNEEETPAERLVRFAPLLKSHPEHPETRMLKAGLLIASEDFPGARKALGTLTNSDPSARAFTIMAAVEKGEGAEDEVVRGWLARAVTGSRGDAWICEKCNTAHPTWAPMCTRCQGFDTLSWKAAAAEDKALEVAAGMLPLIEAPEVDVADRDPEPENDSEV